MNTYEGTLTELENTSIGIVVSKFNKAITDNLLKGALEGLKAYGIQEENISVAYVPGTVEIPLAAQKFAESGDVDAVIALGAVIRGDTNHYDYVCQMVSSGVQQVALETGTPVIFSVLTTDTEEQAKARSKPKSGKDNKGYEGALAALEMVSLVDQMPIDMSWLEDDEFDFEDEYQECDEESEDECDEDCECEYEEIEDCDEDCEEEEEAPKSKTKKATTKR
jgi:6,7-dimethyl-8-ribityllumazine synthase